MIWVWMGVVFVRAAAGEAAALCLFAEFPDYKGAQTLRRLKLSTGQFERGNG